MSTIPKNKKSIVFIGFMGVGKSTIGELVSQKLDRDYIDSDKEIENKFNMPIPKIFENFGEKVFREKEKQLITELCNNRNKVISLGGGAFLQEEIRETCLSKCIVVYLDISWKIWKERLGILIDNRPVLQGRTIEEIKELFTLRKETYSQHHLKVNTDNKDIDAISDEIIETLNL